MGKTKRVIVHPHPDLDACACVAFSGVDARAVHFLPAGETKLPAQCPCCGEKFTGDERVLDHPLGDKGRLEDNGIRHAAACSMPEADSADPDLLREIDEQDSTGEATPRFSLGQIVAAVRREASDRGIRGVALDREVLSSMTRVIRGLNLAHLDREYWREVARRDFRFEAVGDFKVAFGPDMETSPNLGIVLNEDFGCSATIFRFGKNLGIARYPGKTAPDLRLLAPHLRGWFIHTAGFLAAWGTRKSPAKSPPPEGTPQTQEELLALLRQVFGASK